MISDDLSKRISAAMQSGDVAGLTEAEQSAMNESFEALMADLQACGVPAADIELMKAGRVDDLSAEGRARIRYYSSQLLGEPKGGTHQ